jgi:amidohydrolase
MEPCDTNGEYRRSVFETVKNSKEALISISHDIHAFPELAFAEDHAARLLADTLADAGFDVNTGTAGLPTAFTASIGKGSLNLFVCAEYDALPTIGHACGHNIIAATAIGVAWALYPIVDSLDITLTIIGTPAEESGNGGKVIMNNAGAFDAAHAVFLLHPAPFDASNPILIASQTFDFTYSGASAHAAAAPQNGVNAADAAVLAQVAIGLLRQQLPMDQRLHGIVSYAGDAANVIPGASEGRYAVRSPNTDDLEALYNKAKKCFDAGALATGCKLDITPARRYAHMVNNTLLARIYEENAMQFKSMSSAPTPVDASRFTPSTDLGVISLERPAIHPFISICDFPVVNHQREFANAAASPRADQAVLDGSSAMAATLLQVAQNTALRTDLIAQTSNAT